MSLLKKLITLYKVLAEINLVLDSKNNIRISLRGIKFVITNEGSIFLVNNTTTFIKAQYLLLNCPENFNPKKEEEKKEVYGSSKLTQTVPNSCRKGSR